MEERLTCIDHLIPLTGSSAPSPEGAAEPHGDQKAVLQQPDQNLLGLNVGLGQKKSWSHADPPL